MGGVRNNYYVYVVESIDFRHTNVFDLCGGTIFLQGYL